MQVLYAQSDISQEENLRQHIYFLASDSLKGRYPGTPEDKIAAVYIRDHFKSAGLELLYKDGLQEFEVVVSVEPSQNNSLTVNSHEVVFNEDYGLYAFSSNASIEAEVVFGGFGMTIDTDELQHNDYTSIDVTDKWVLVLKGDPEPDDNQSAFIPFANTRSKAMFARDQGAAGILLVGGRQNHPDDEAAPFVVERSVQPVGIPVLDLRKTLVDEWLLASLPDTDSLESLMIEGVSPAEISLSARVSATVELEKKYVTTYNVVAALPGYDSLLRNEYIVFGAHYDHLGMGGPGSGSRHPDTIAPHYGADDNASGVAGLLEMARYYAGKSERNRSLLFVAFGAEEMGLLGSHYFVHHPPVDREQMVTMLNFDMIGRLNAEKSMAIGGTGTALETEPMLKAFADHSALQFAFSPEGFGASDHANFYARDIPVMFFTTGAHSDYHTPFDTPDKINYEGMQNVLEFIAMVSDELIYMPQKLTFQEAGPRERQRSGRGFKVTLGIMPDFTAGGDEGLPVGGVTKGGPADGAGMLRGDIIVAINGLSVGNIYDYMNRLNQLKKGERANVDVLRNGEKIVLIVDL